MLRKMFPLKRLRVGVEKEIRQTSSRGRQTGTASDNDVLADQSVDITSPHDYQESYPCSTLVTRKHGHE